MKAFLIAVLLCPHLTYADPIEDFGIGLSRDELIQEGFKVKAQQGTQVFEKKSDSSTTKLVAIKEERISVMFQSPEGNHLQTIQLEKESGRALAKTSCTQNSTQKSYQCRTQTHLLCRSLMWELDKDLMYSGLEKLKECNSILSRIKYDESGIKKAQAVASQSLKSDLNINASQISFAEPKAGRTLTDLIEDLSECKKLENRFVGSKWAFEPRQDPSTTKQRSAEGIQ